MSEHLIFNEFFKGKILKIELNNLSKKNALSLEMLTEMASKLSQNNYIIAQIFMEYQMGSVQ